MEDEIPVAAGPVRVEWRGLNWQGASSLLMRVMNQALTVGLDFPGGPRTTRSHPTPRQDLTSLDWGVPGALGPLGRCALVYMDDCLVHSPTLEQQLLDAVKVLEIFRRRHLYAKSSKCEFSRQELGILGHRLSKVVCWWISARYSPYYSIVEWATSTSCSEVRRL